MHTRSPGWLDQFVLCAGGSSTVAIQMPIEDSTDPPLESTIHEKMSCVDICMDDCTIYVVGAIGRSNDRVGLNGHRLIRNINTVR
jgi:hypothetical protein